MTKRKKTPREHVADIRRETARHLLPAHYVTRRHADDTIAHAKGVALVVLDELEAAALAAVREHFAAARRSIVRARPRWSRR